MNHRRVTLTESTDTGGIHWNVHGGLMALEPSARIWAVALAERETLAVYRTSANRLIG